MKRWYKLSLIGLVVPTAVGVSLVSVGCGNGNQTSTTADDTNPIVPTHVINTPSLVQNPLIIATSVSVQAWWQSFDGNVSQQVRGLNQIFTKETQLDPNLVDQIILNYDGLYSFRPVIQLIPHTTFQNNQTSWLAPFYITYSNNNPKVATSYPYPKFLNQQIFGSPSTAQAWWNDLKNVSQQVNALNQYISKETQLNANIVQKIDFISVSDNTFYITVYLKSTYVFVNKMDYWFSSTITYHTNDSMIHQVVVPELVAKATISAPQSNPQTWWNGFNKNVNKQVNAINQVLKTGAKLDANAVKNIDFAPISVNSFNVTVHLKPNYIFKNNLNTWTNSEPIGFNVPYFTKINLPSFYPNPTLTGPQPNAQAWWDDFKNNLTKQIDGLRQLFDNKLELDANVVKNIAFMAISFTKFKFTIYLNNNARFKDGSSSWESSDVTYKSASSLPIPVLKSSTFSAWTATPKAWWDQYNGNLSQETKFVNSLFTTDTQLPMDSIDNFEFTQLSVNKFTVLIHLKLPYTFDGNPTIKISLNYFVTLAIYHPTLKTSFSWPYQPISESSNNALSWWKYTTYFNVNKQVEVFNQICIDGKLNVDWVSNIGINSFGISSFGGYVFNFVVTLNDRYQFIDGKNTWISPTIQMYVL